MPDYDFRQLSPHDFELMCRDLLQAEWGVMVESFKTGRDGGIDLRYARGDAHTIIQCKRFIDTGLSGLLRETRREADKVVRLKPKRYLLMTAVPLSPRNKAEIVEIIGAAYLAPTDVLGRADLNNLLARHPDVERANYKLWLASTNVLEQVLHNDVLLQSQFQVEKVHAEIRRYVQGSAYPRALEALKTDRVVILSGLPGVGKTTLANMLLYEHLSRGYEPVVIRENFAEGKRLFRKGRRQVFYFDDFMGVTFLGDKGSGDQQRQYRAILEFIEMVSASKDKRLILTTREHMLHQAWAASEQLRHSGVLERKVVVRMGDYGYRQRAEILYNHIFFSDLPRAYRDELLRGDFYLEIIRHHKFNPRLIQWLSSYRRVRAVPVDQYQAFVRQLLNDPSEIWRHAYEQQISNAGRSLLLALYSLGGRAGEDLLRDAFLTLHTYRAAKYGWARRPEEYGVARAELNGAFLQPSYGGVEFINPAVTDWLNSVLRDAPENAVDLILGATSFAQIERVWSFAASNQGAGVRSALGAHGVTIAPKLAMLATAPRAVPTSGGAIGYTGSNYERRLAIAVEIADQLRDPAFVPALEAIIARIRAEQLIEHCDIGSMIGAVRGIDSASWPALAPIKAFRDECIAEVGASAAAGCSSGELRDIVGLLDAPGDAVDRLRAGAKDAFETFIGGSFEEELANCQSERDYQQLIDDLELFEATFDVDVSNEVALVRDGLDEHYRYEEQYADQAMDARKERMHSELAGDAHIRDMFGSLRSDG